MSSPIHQLVPRVQAAMAAAFGAEYADADPVIRPSQFADVQVNAAMALAKRVGANPREVAARIIEHLDVDDMCEPLEVSGPGFLNVRFREAWLAEQAQHLLADPRLGVAEQPRQIVAVDYSAPNVAKEMHVGHIRTTGVGDSLVLVLEKLGHDVIRQNHVGDWGTNFGMLIEHLLEVGEDSDEAELLISSPNDFYQAAREKFNADPDFARRSRARVTLLQSGDEATLAHWHRLVDLSKKYFNRVYTYLDVTLRDEHLAGESMYNDDLAAVCDELEKMGLAVESDGALCVFLDEFLGRDGTPSPMIIRKSDGGYGYATTDLATVRHRVRKLRTDRMLYVIGEPQSRHLQMVWTTARKAGWLPEDVEVVHVQIGTVVGSDGKMLKTREGETPKLMDALEEAVARAVEVMAQQRPDLDEDTRATIAWQVGIGAVKYADLSISHDSPYLFDLDRMLALTGNTGPYLQYATARITSIFRKAGLDPTDCQGPIRVHTPEEKALVNLLLDYGDTVAKVGAVLEPHRLCTYLFDLAQAFSAFYENCPVLKADDDADRYSRLALAALTERVLVDGLGLLGIQSPEQM